MTTPDINTDAPAVEGKGMSTTTGSVIGTFIGVLLGTVALYVWEYMKTPKDNKLSDTGEKTPAGNAIVEATGVGGTDSGVKVRGYELPVNIDDVTPPITVVVRPNQNLFLQYKAGEKVTFIRKRSDELIFIQTEGTHTGEYAEWYPNLRKKVLGAIS
jgi:hypothetical protein